jgi:hypothetical protein
MPRRAATKASCLGLGLSPLWLCLGAVLSVAPATAGGIFDGIYRGTGYAAVGNDPICARDRPERPIIIQDDHFMRIIGSGRVDVTVAPDGTFSASAIATVPGAFAVSSLAGRISGGKLEGDQGHHQCTFHLSMTKS